MFNQNQLKLLLTPLGYTCKKSEKISETDFDDIFNMEFTGTNAMFAPVVFSISISLPKLINGSERIFCVESASGLRTRVVAPIAYKDISDLSSETLTVIPWQRIVIRAINDIISDSLMTFHHGGDLPPDDLITDRIYNFFNTSEAIYDIEIDDLIKTKSVLDIINLEIEEKGIDHQYRTFSPSWINYLDPTSTSVGTKINKTYRLCHGAKIDGNTIKASDITPFCTTIHEHGIAQILNPRRAYLIRNTIENSEKLVEPEVPIIRQKNVTNHVEGTHLLTAIMDYKSYTYEDSICISKSAAQKMACYVYKKISFSTIYEAEILVKPGSAVFPDTRLLYVKETDTYISGFNKLYSSGTVTSINKYTVVSNGKVKNCYNFLVTCIYPLRNGDKISNRGASKGVVHILDDSFMPVDKNGRTIEVCISPNSIAKRRIMSLYWEMMVHKIFYNRYNSDSFYEEVDPDNLNPKPSFNTLVEQGHGEPEQLYLNDISLPELTFIGEIFWIRLNKHAIENVSSVYPNTTVLNQYNLPIDAAKISGQRFDLAKAMAFCNRDQLFADIFFDKLQHNNNAIDVFDSWKKALE